MKTYATFGRNARRTEALLRQLEERSSVATTQLEPVVRRILLAVRRNGDAGLRRYAHKLDGLAAATPLRVSHEEMARRGNETPKELGCPCKLQRRTFAALHNGRCQRIGRGRQQTACNSANAAYRSLLSAAMFPADVILCPLHY